MVSVSHSLEKKLYSCIFNSYVKAYLNIWWRRMYGLKLFCLLPVGVCNRCVRNDWQLCLVGVNSLTTHLQLKKMSVIYQSAHVAITFQLLEMSSITNKHPTKQFRISHKVQAFQRKISAILPIRIMKIIKSGSSVQMNRFGYWNSCKRLPNFGKNGSPSDT